MKPLKSVLIVLAIASLLLPNCAKKKKAEVIQPTPEIPMMGADVDAHGCKATAGYQWSDIQKACIRSFELPLQLLHAEKSYGAGVLFSANKKQAEVFSVNATLILEAQSAVLYTCNANGADWYLEKRGKKWMFGKKGEGKPSYSEQ